MQGLAVVRGGSVGPWTASHCTVTAGVTIGRSCLIAANSAVTKSFSSGSMIAGVPGRLVRVILEESA